MKESSPTLQQTLNAYTPVEKLGKLWFKREDKYAPNGYGSVNGSKLRQCIYLIQEYAVNANKAGVVSGAVSGSPQHPMVTFVAKQMGLESIIVTGVGDISKYPYLVMAERLGATFVNTNIGYAKALNSKAAKIAEQNPQLFHLETNITMDEKLNSPARLSGFHDVGGLQVMNIPDEVETLLIPAGSCNSATSILHGLAKYGAKNIKQIYLFGIGNYGSSKPSYIRDRLSYMQKANKLDYSIFQFEELDEAPAPIKVNRFDINGSGYARYEDLMPATYEGIVFHPRYEGKIWNYIQSKGLTELLNDKTLFWVVGSEPR
jgi:hypothetical protein